MSNQLVVDQIQTHLGLSESTVKTIAEAVQQCLGATYVLYAKTQNYHWNVTGEHFSALHTLFEEQYQEYIAAIDELAERIRQFGYFVPAHFSAYTQSAVVQEETAFPSAQDMVKNLMVDNTAVAALLGQVIAQLEDMGADAVTIGLLSDRMTVHEKNAWFLRSHLPR